MTPPRAASSSSMVSSALAASLWYSWPIHFVILSSISSRLLPYLSLDTLITLSSLPVFCASGCRVTPLNGWDDTPLIMSFKYIWYLVRFTMSLGVKVGSNSLSSASASVAPMRNKIMVPTFPKTASLILVLFSVINCPIYWCAIVRFKRYFLASERIVANDSVAKFWNSST